MSWDEIGRGLAAMGAAMGETAIGGLLNTLSGFGAAAISEIAEPLGTLAESMKKWQDVTVPQGLGTQLGLLATGVLAFTFGQGGAGAIAEVAAPLGVMADSIKKWETVTVPDGIQDDLESISKGVKSFSFAFAGGWSISALTTPLADLAGSVNQWNGVTVPEGIEDKLTGIAKGIEAFSFAFAGGWSISQLITPLGDLSEAISKWNGVTIPEGLGKGLQDLSEGIKSYGLSTGISGWSLGEDFIEKIKKLGSAMQSWDNVVIPDGLAEKLGSLADGMKQISSAASEVGDISSMADSIGALGDSLVSLANDDFYNAIGSIQNFTNSIDALDFSSSGKKLGGDLVSGFEEGTNAFSTKITTIFGDLVSNIEEQSSNFSNAGKTLMEAISTSFANNGGTLASSLNSTITACVIAIRGYYSMFYDAGSYVVSGFAAGISQNTYMATAKASAMASAAASALKINSPSRVFMELGGYVPAGMAVGIDNMSYLVGNSIDSMTSSAVNLAETAMNRMNSKVGSQLNLSPTIRPVLDLSEIQNGARTIDGMFSSNMASRLDFAMNESLSYDPNGNIVSELGKLRRDIGEMDRSVYNVNGITYDDGSNIADAIRTLVRATIVEGRV